MQRCLVSPSCQARVGARKFQKVILTVSPRGISLQDADTKEMVENISIYRISYCTTDKLQNKVFAYVAQSQESGALECHAFLSPKKKIAQAVTLTVAQAFQMALDLWEAAHAGSRQEQPLHPSCVLESSEPGRPSEPAPPGSPPFRHQFGEEEEEEEGDNVGDTLPGVSTSRAQSKLSYYAVTVLPPGATPRRLEGAGRSWSPPHAWPHNCWPPASPGLSHIPAATDQPLRTHPVPALPWHCPLGAGAAGTAALSTATAAPAPSPALCLHEPLKPSCSLLLVWAAGPLLPVRAEPPAWLLACRAPGTAPSDLLRLFLPHPSSWGPAEAEQLLEMEDLLGLCPPQGAPGLKE
ncbi:PREDICTED: uncharacterized protein LOC106890505 isoform X2 [Calidris pugnax]|uniref:uncharacterized protein LOC106890505 isoform X2 n=1 Tax=Calidris pugnax TaxID=198806 RepID=UPI00071D6BDB|nr:PREDICTED: uncharacterized protein LOC106890505 isoform X2 [Calidris pugnax]